MTPGARKFSTPVEEIKLLDGGGFRGYLSTFGNVDHYGDVVERGAFDGWLRKHQPEPTVPVLWQHKSDVPIGVGTVGLDSKGLVIDGSLVSETEVSRVAKTLARAGVLGLSMGYSTLDSWTDQSGIRHLVDVDLWEASLVTFAANPQAVLTSVKSGAVAAEELVPCLKRVTAELQAWDGTTSERRRHDRVMLRDLERRAEGLHRRVDSMMTVATRNPDPAPRLAPTPGEVAAFLRDRFDAGLRS